MDEDTSNFWGLPGTQLGVNLHLGAFERQTRKFGAKSYQVNKMVGDMCDTIEQLNDLGKPKIDNIARLQSMSTGQPTVTLDTIHTLMVQHGERLSNLESK